MNILFYTLGCKVNQYETQAIKEQFHSIGYDSNEELKADVIVINTCTVTGESDRKSRQLLRKLRRENPNAIIVLTGCMVQAFPENSNLLTDADIVIGNQNPYEIIECVNEFIKEKSHIFEVSPHMQGEKYFPISVSDFSERTRAYMKIEDGCDRFCTYCIIPTARGRVRSRNLTDIKSEAKRLANSGYKEIVLVGINLSAYGMNTDYNICDAVETVADIEGIERIRLGSLEPDHITDTMLLRLKSVGKFCPQFHLSLQSGCDSTLKRMNRHYDSAFYYDLVKRIRKTFENASITTDIMVGFAGETESEFEQSVSFAKSIGFARMHVFSYSRRNGTVAAALKNQVTNTEKSNRAKIMSNIAKESEVEFLNSQIGLTCPVLFETGESGILEGYTPNYSKVKIKSNCDLKGKILDVKLIRAENDYCIGSLV